jgi:hypothetical protein
MTDGSNQPALDITQTPEFQEAVAKAAAQAADNAIQQFAAQLAAKTHTGDVGGNNDTMEKLALAIAELTDQGVGMHKVRVAPEVLVRRQHAYERMVKMLDTLARTILDLHPDKAKAAAMARGMGIIPVYRLRDKVYVAHRVVEPFVVGNDKVPRPTEIEWRGVPNGVMKPLNDAAKKIFAEYEAWIGGAPVKRNTGEALWVTAGGLVVRGTPQQRKVVNGVDASVPVFTDLEDDAPELQPEDDEDYGMHIRAPINPNAKEVAILGTVAPPAKQNFAGAV